MTCCDTWWPRTAPRTGRPWVSERLGVACAVGAIDSCRRLLPPAAREDSQDAHEHPRDLPMPLPRLHTSPFMIPVLSSLLPLSPPRLLISPPAPPLPAAEHFVDRTDVQCLHRWQKVLNPEVHKGPWTAEEDKAIMQ